ncbi:YciI family protein [Bordetella sputigena]|uniref:YciI family protein n=1 Tax=Bordetella sputigena TaxID=1416810 RepID=UPI0039EF74A3
MLYAIHMLDKPGVTEIRTRIRPEHRAYLATKADQMAFAGPLLADDGETMIGSLLVIDFPSRDAAEQWLRDEPFTRNGVYGSTSIHAFANLWPQKVGFPAG